ncbi:hypothetical protein [Mesotoga sp.]|uniref:hypothetical protein n=1 Tax=Mesotoga sp. TaxID=2053577 RepID=UPI00345EE17B
MKDVQVKFLPGDTAYLLSEAQQGRMTQCKISGVMLTASEVEYFNSPGTYLNSSIYYAKTLLSEAEARKIALDFHKAEEAKLLSQINDILTEEEQ